MQLTTLDWVVVAVYGAITLTLGFWFSRRAGQNIEEYFVAGRTLPWWVAGTSIAATWFATDAPLATASLVRQQGIFANWLWWYEAAGIMLLASGGGQPFSPTPSSSSFGTRAALRLSCEDSRRSTRAS